MSTEIDRRRRTLWAPPLPFLASLPSTPEEMRGTSHSAPDAYFESELVEDEDEVVDKTTVVNVQWYHQGRGCCPGWESEWEWPSAWD